MRAFYTPISLPSLFIKKQHDSSNRWIHEVTKTYLKIPFLMLPFVFSTTFSQCSPQPRGDRMYDESLSTNFHLQAIQCLPLLQEAAARGDFCPSWSPEANTCASCRVKACSIFLSARLSQTSNSCFPVCCWEEDSPASSQSYPWMCLLTVDTSPPCWCSGNFENSEHDLCPDALQGSPKWRLPAAESRFASSWFTL